MKQRFIALFWFVSWTSISVGININVWPINMEIHLPFGFIKIGWEEYEPGVRALNEADVAWRAFNFLTWKRGKNG